MPILYECSKCRKTRYPKGFGMRGKMCLCRRDANGRKPRLDREGTRQRVMLLVHWRRKTPAAVRRAAMKVT